MHRAILGLSDSEVKVDHIDGNGLNNQRGNLRSCTNSENIRNSQRGRKNTSGYKGVAWFGRTSKWHARITFERKSYHLGYFLNAEDAARAYDHAARRLYGEFARTNFPVKDS